MSSVISTVLLLGLGSNVGNSRLLLRNAVHETYHESKKIVEGAKFSINVSPLYQTAPVDTLDQQDDYWNAVLMITLSGKPWSETLLTQKARAWLTMCQAIEAKAGRVRTHYHASRTLDIDLLMVGALVINDANLTLPHPSMGLRRFVMEPLMALAPTLILPVFGQVQDVYSALMRTPNILNTQPLRVMQDNTWADINVRALPKIANCDVVARI